MKKSAALVTAALTVVLLAGCASGGSGSGGDATPTPKTQTKAEACKTLESQLKSVSSELQSQMSTIQSDPTTAVAKLKEFDAKLKTATDDVTNPDVHDAANDFEGSFSKLVTQLEAFAKDPQSADSAALQSSISDVQQSTQTMSKVCG